MNESEEKWTLVISPGSRFFSWNPVILWQYRDLAMMFVRRDFVTQYRQSLLGPVWYILQPLFTTIMYMFVFGGLAGIPTDGVPQPLFYLSGIALWNYFSETLTKSSDTFITNQAIFGKVYFPRIIVPVSNSVSGLIKLGIQLALFGGLYLVYIFQGTESAIQIHALLFPVLMVILGGLALGFGIIISSLTTRYRDLRFLFTFAVQLWMFATPVIYPLSITQGRFESYAWLIKANPVTPVMEIFRYGFLGQGTFSWMLLGYSFLCMLLVLILGILIFNKVERTSMDVV